MDQKQRLILMAEDELTEYSTEARKIEKLRQKYALAVPFNQLGSIRNEIAADMPNNFVADLVENQRQAVALPFWGIGGLGLLLGISFTQPLDFIATGIGFYTAIMVQRWGWSLEARRLVIKTIDELTQRDRNPAEAE